MKDFKDYYKELLRENSEKKEESKASFEDNVVSSVKKLDNPETTVKSSRGDNFSKMDTAIHSAKMISAYLTDPKPRTQFEEMHLQKNITGLTDILGKDTVDALMKQHFPEHK